MCNLRGEINMTVDCGLCKYRNTDICLECTVWNDEGCSCHISPPCSTCVNSKFEDK